MILVTVGSMFPFERMIRMMDDWASQGKGRRIFSKLQKAIQKMSVPDRTLLLSMAAKIVGKRSRA